MKISHKLCVRMDGSQFLWLWWFTAKNHSPQTFGVCVGSSEFQKKFSLFSTHILQFTTSAFLIYNIYLFQIPGAETATIAANSIAATTNGGRLCGRVLASATAKASNAGSTIAGTVCGK